MEVEKEKDSISFDSEIQTRVAFSTLKPICLRVMQALQLASDNRSRRSEANALREPLQALESLLISANETMLPKRGLPRCIDYILIPLIMALPTAITTPENMQTNTGSNDRIFRAITALITACGVEAFWFDNKTDQKKSGAEKGIKDTLLNTSTSSRVDNVILRVAVCLSEFTTLRKQLESSSSSYSTSSVLSHSINPINEMNFQTTSLANRLHHPIYEEPVVS